MNNEVDTHQTQIESIQISLDEDWYDSNSYESIQSKSESFMIQFTEIWVDSGKKEVKNICWQHLNRFKLLWIDSMVNRFKKTVNLFRKTLNRFTAILFRKTVNRFNAILFIKNWLDSKGVTQGKWTKEMLDMNQWIMNRIKQFIEGFSKYENTQDIKESHDTIGVFSCEKTKISLH